ncbi:cytochrome c oxidase subunit II [Deinococcus budaensis]|uniref:Cytochrome c oxidase subunit 2 n=1 Tax=Deinococcus budaensis TaxID=1665626 RepID=A0A7W8GJ48_9DEIO|nr:cytochrome c oxidase subunit II [Deinococcus budaensis]MBB5236071.1 cytochrome c oxidase subunit 2 [Deinococcus budaensis]
MSRPASPAPVPRLEHHTLERYENIWFGIAVVMSVLLFVAVLTSFISGTYSAVQGEGAHHITGVTNGRLDPRNLAATPFAQPGLRENPDGTLEAFVVSRAFAYDPPVLRVPAGRPVTIHVTSADVMHGYYVEGTNINVNVVPGQVASLTATFRQPGDHSVICNEYCGAGHHNMLGRVVVETAQP